MDRFFKGKRLKYPKLLQEHSLMVEQQGQQQQQQQQLQVLMGQQLVQVHILEVLITRNRQLSHPIISSLLVMCMINLNKTQPG